jgi:RecA-family ATPase
MSLRDDFQMPAGYEQMPPQAQERARRNIQARHQQASISPRALTPGDGVCSPNAWDNNIPGRDWLVNGIIPLAQTTLLTGNGGEGKTLIAAQLAASTAIGIPWLGYPVKRVRTIMVHCEDDRDEMKRRFNGILAPQRYSFADLDDLLLIDRDGENNLLYEAMFNDTNGRWTEFFARLTTTVKDFGAQLIVLDSLYNFFGGNEISRPQVTEFVGGLRKLAKQCNAAVVIVGHPGRAGMGQGGDGTSGSTAWHNAVRSRFYLHRKKHPSGDPDKKGPLVLEHMKANYGQTAEPIELCWEQGRFVPVRSPEMPMRARTDTDG